MTAALKVKTKEISNCRKKCPTGERLPKISRRKKPTTVGGKTIGNKMRASSSDLPRLRFITRYASAIPTKKFMTVAAAAVFIDIISGSMI